MTEFITTTIEGNNTTMDRDEPTGTTNSNNNNSEVSAARRILDGTGNFLGDNRNKVMAVLAAGALTITLAGCGSNARAEGPAPTATISAEPSPGPSVSSTPSSSETPATNPDYTPGIASVKDGVEVQIPENTTSEFIDSGEFIGEHLEQTKTLEEMNKMSVEEFAQLPYGDRIAFAVLTFFKPGQELTSPYLPVGNDDFDGNAWTIPSSSWQSLANLAFNHEDPDTRAKLAGTYSYYTTDKQDGQISSSYQAAADTVVRNGREGVSGDFVFEYVSNGKVQHGIDRDSKPIDFMNITYKQGFSSTIDSVTDVKTGQAIRTDVTLLDGGEFIYYALGYVIDGVRSPADGYDY
ncbi:hypothetical protein ACTWLI_13020 [Arthrobacter sp. Hor0625]|uniref:hypothetical protein n=1 Tax=Arthrobacter sp. Hor0625 TaxID=3457358 RepID=UPI00403E8FF1